MNRTTTPPPADNLVVLAADLLAAAVESMMAELAGAGKWPAALRVRQCLETYACAREGQIIADPDPQRMNAESCPQTSRSGGET